MPLETLLLAAALFAAATSWLLLAYDGLTIFGLLAPGIWWAIGLAAPVEARGDMLWPWFWISTGETSTFGDVLCDV